MLVPSGVAAVLGLLLLVYCLLNIATTPEEQVRTLPKPVWLLLVILLPFVGSIAWLLAGRPQRAAGAAGTRAPRLRQGRPPPTVGPQTAGPQAAQRPSPDDDESFLRSLRERAEEQRRRAAERDTPPDPDQGTR